MEDTMVNVKFTSYSRRLILIRKTLEFYLDQFMPQTRPFSRMRMQVQLGFVDIVKLMDGCFVAACR